METHCSLLVAHGDISNIHRDTHVLQLPSVNEACAESRDACNMVHCFNRPCQVSLQTTPFEVLYCTIPVCIRKIPSELKKKKNRFESGKDACNMVHCFNRTCQAALQTTPFEVLYHTCEHKKTHDASSNPSPDKYDDSGSLSAWGRGRP